MRNYAPKAYAAAIIIALAVVLLWLWLCEMQ
jgi:hypothetical protein